MSVLWLAGGVAMIGGVGCGKEILTRIGYAFSGFGWLFFSIGSMLAPLLPDAQQGLAGSSALTPAHGYGLLAVWMLLTALTEWGGDLDPHD